VTVAIVTDSTAYLPDGAQAAGVRVVPLRVQLGERTTP
jgi:fatty acid-binding protein DegV